MRLLVVEPDSEQRAQLRAVLSTEPTEVVWTRSGREGLEAAQFSPPDAVLVSLNLQDLSASDFCLALREYPETARTVVFVIGGPGPDQGVSRAFDMGADDYLVLPCSAKEFSSRLRNRVRQRASSWFPDEQEALLGLTRLLASSLDMNRLLYLVAVRTAQLLQVDRCSLVLMSDDDKRANVVATSEDESFHNFEVTLADYPEIQEVLRTRRPFVVEKVEEHPALRDILPTLVDKGVGSLALFPMKREDDVCGMLILRSVRFSRELSERDIFFANAVAASVALALQNLDAVRSERKIASELQRTKEFLENLIDSSVDAIVAADLKGNIILFNKGAERIFGHRAENVLGQLHVTQLYPGDGAREVMELLGREGNGGQDRLNTSRREVLNQQGESVPIQLTAWCVKEGGKIVATAGIFTDLRERLRIERKLSLAQEKLMKSEQQAMIAELAGATAHELNQPLTSVLGYTELAKRKLKTQEGIERILDIILSETERMADIVRKIGKITRYETKSYLGRQRIADIERSSDSE